MARGKAKSKNKKEDNSLTLAEETFVQELIKGKSQREAYRIAYKRSKNWTDNATDVNASRLYNKPKVSLRLSILKQQIVDESTEDTIMKAKEILEIYTKIARGEETEEVFVSDMGMSVKKTKKPSLKDRIKALERLDKIMALEKNNEQESNVKDDGLTKQIGKLAKGDIWEDFDNGDS